MWIKIYSRNSSVIRLYALRFVCEKGKLIVFTEYDIQTFPLSHYSFSCTHSNYVGEREYKKALEKKTHTRDWKDNWHIRI